MTKKIVNTISPFNIGWAAPELNQASIIALLQAAQAGQLSTGPHLARFEQTFQNFHKGGYAKVAPNCHSALKLLLQAYQIGPGDEVIVPALTFAAPLNAVVSVGARPIIADVDASTWTINPQEVEARLSKKTKAIFAVHLFGNPCDMSHLKTFKMNSKKILLFEDCAQALGGQYKDKLVGTWGDAAAFSFNATKTLITGEGGMALFKLKKQFIRARIIANHGMDKRKYFHSLPGENYKLPNLLAALGVAGLESLAQIIKDRKALMQHFLNLLSPIQSIQLQATQVQSNPVPWGLPIILPNLKIKKNLIMKLEQEKIEWRPLFRPMYKMPAFKKLANKQAVADVLSHHGLILPFHLSLSKSQIEKITQTIKSVL